MSLDPPLSTASASKVLVYGKNYSSVVYVMVYLFQLLAVVELRDVMQRHLRTYC